MADGSLQRTGVSSFPGARYPSALHLLAGVLLLRGYDPADAQLAALVSSARRRAVEAVKAGRAGAGEEDLLAFTLLYASARALASRIGPARTLEDSAHPAFAALACLRHRQRAALAIHHVLGLSVEDVGTVVGVGEMTARGVIATAATAVARRMETGIDVAGELRSAAPDVLASSVRRSRPLALVPDRDGWDEPRMPRDVVRSLLGPVPAPITEDAPPPVARPAGPTARDRRRFRRALGYATVAAVVAIAALAPVAAREASPPTVASKPPSVSEPVRASVSVAAAVVVRVRRGDSLWAIAGRALGDPHRWPEIWRANRGRAMGGGQRFARPDLIRPGWVLRIPPPEVSGSSADPAPTG